MYTTCGQVFWSTEACGECDMCNSEREIVGRVFRAAQRVLAEFENHPGKLSNNWLVPAMRELQRALDREPA